MSSAVIVNLDVLGRIGVALADETRRRLLAALLDAPAYPAELADQLGLTRANVSNHLACLRGCGLVATQQEGRRVRYELADARLTAAIHQLLHVVLTVDTDACPTADAGDDCC